MSPRTPTPLGAALRSLLIPGWGQLATGRPVLGRTLIFITEMVAMAGVAAFIFFGPFEPATVAAWLADPDVLLGLVLVNLGLAAIRILSIWLAWLGAGGAGWTLILTIVIIVAIPHAAIAWMGLETRQTLTTLFAPTSEPARREPTPSTVSSSTTTTNATTTTFELTSVPSFAGQTEALDIDAVPRVPWLPFGEDRLNILVLGGDSGPGRRGIRTDTMIVASADPVSGRAALFGIPRNFGGITFTDGTVPDVKILNEVYQWGDRHPGVFGGDTPGADALSDAIANITGLEIDYYVLVDITGFGSLVDALGGVSVNVAEPVAGPLYDPVTGGYEMVVIPSGAQELDGDHALAYARARYGSSDYVRMGRQRCLLTALAARAEPISLISRLPDLMGVIEDHVVTDIPLDKLPDLVRLVSLVSTQDVVVAGFDRTWRSGLSPLGHPIPDVERIRAFIRATIADPMTSSGSLTAANSCG